MAKKTKVKDSKKEVIDTKTIKDLLIQPGTEKTPALSKANGLLITLAAAALLFFVYSAVDYYTAWGNTPKLIKRSLESAEKSAIYKHYPEAIKNYESLINRFGNNEAYKEETKQAKLSLAKTYKDSEQYIKAIDMYKQLGEEYKDTNPDMHAWLMLELADSYNSILNTEEAIRVYNGITKDFAGTDWAAEALFGIADAYRSKKDYINAVKYYDIIINKYEKGFLSAEALTNKGKIYEELGKEKLALKVYEKVVKEFPEIVTEFARLRYDVLSGKTQK
jgi:tetratricopeptide (TPR) repeat protein